MSKIVLEDFNEGDGYYKVNLAYLSKEQVEEIETLVSKWHPTDEDIKSCIGMCLTDANEQRFKDYNTTLKDCLNWFENQENSETHLTVPNDDNSEEIRKEIIKYLEQTVPHNHRDEVLKSKEWIAWLEKQNTQNLVEWSEKDEYNYNTILHHLDLRKEKYKKECNQEEQDRYQGLYDWLKSIRPQNHWKTSKEQMSRLKWIAHQKARRL